MCIHHGVRSEICESIAIYDVSSIFPICFIPQRYRPVTFLSFLRRLSLFVYVNRVVWIECSFWSVVLLVCGGSGVVFFFTPFFLSLAPGMAKHFQNAHRFIDLPSMLYIFLLFFIFILIFSLSIVFWCVSYLPWCARCTWSHSTSEYTMFVLAIHITALAYWQHLNHFLSTQPTARTKPKYKINFMLFTEHLASIFFSSSSSYIYKFMNMDAMAKCA